MTKLYGRSLSLCVRDILDNKVSLDDVQRIVTSTKFESVEQIMEYYYDTYWSEHFPDRVHVLLLVLWNSRTLVQPRLIEPSWYQEYVGGGQHWTEIWQEAIPQFDPIKQARLNINVLPHLWSAIWKALLVGAVMYAVGALLLVLFDLSSLELFLQYWWYPLILAAGWTAKELWKLTSPDVLK